MPRAFLIREKAKVKKAKADSSTPDILDLSKQDNPEKDVESRLEEVDRHQVEIVRMPFGVSKEGTCSPDHSPANFQARTGGTVAEKVFSRDGADGRYYVDSSTNNNRDNSYQLHSVAKHEKNSQIHLSEVKVETVEIDRLTKSLRQTDDCNTIEERQLESKHGKTTKRLHGNYSILEPLHHNAAKRPRLSDGSDISDVYSEREFTCEGRVANKTLMMSGGGESPTYIKEEENMLPAFSKSFQNNSVVSGDLNATSEPSVVDMPSLSKSSKKYTIDEVLKKSPNRDVKKNRNSLPYPFWSPLKIEVPQFEPSPVKMARYFNPNAQLLGRGGYQLTSSPVRSDISPPSVSGSPLYGHGMGSQHRDSDSDKDTSSERSSPSDQEMYHDSDASSDRETPNGHPRGHFWTHNNRPIEIKPRNVIPTLRSPVVEEKPRPGGGLRLHDPYFWQNNIPNIPVDYQRRMTPLQMPENFQDFPLMPLPHYLSYLSAMEKGVVPMLPPMWKPTEGFQPYFVNPVFMDARNMQYQAEKLKCQSPVYNKNHLTPNAHAYNKSVRDRPVTINEHIKLNERPSSLESMASDRLSTVSEDSTANVLESIKGSSAKFSDKSSVKYNCEWCGKTYSTFSGLSKHKQFHCSKQITKHFNCQHCDKEYTSLGALKMHIRTHTLPCKCHICGKAFSRPWLLQGHIRTHTGEKPFSCQHCSRAFADRSNLRAHLQTHSDVKKYNCEKCNKSFSRMSLLIKHRDNGCSGLIM